MEVMMVAIKTSWIIEVVRGLNRKEFGRTFYSGCGKYGTLLLAEADLSDTRRAARDLAYGGTEVVRKVELDENGKAFRIIKGR
jgi:hypothetical protein